MPQGKARAGGKLKKMATSLEDKKALLNQIGLLLVAESQSAFKKQAWNGKAWPPRSPINVFGIISDFAQGRTKPPSRRFESKPALIDTGALRKSIAHRVVGKKRVIVGTTIEYAPQHQSGGATKSAKITDAMRQAMWKWLRNQSPAVKKAMGWTLNRKFRNKQIEGEVPARPFLGTQRSIMKKVAKALEIRISRIA